MSLINPKPIILKDVTVIIGADNYEKQLSTVVLTPAAATQVWQGLTPAASYSDTPAATWSAELGYAQDWETAGSLSRYLFNNEGAQVTAVFKPRAGGGSSFQVQLVLTPGAIGGAVNAWQEATVTLGIIGRPVEILPGSGVPLLTTANPTSGSIAGGNLVQISGSGFTGATAVRFGAVAATTYSIVSDTLIVAQAPAQAAGSKPIQVTNASGTSLAEPYTYV